MRNLEPMVRGPARTKEPCPCQSPWRRARAAHASVPLPAPGQGTVMARLPGLLRENGGQPGAIGTFLPGLGRGSRREAPSTGTHAQRKMGWGQQETWGGGGSAVCLGPASLRPMTRAFKWVSLGEDACFCMQVYVCVQTCACLYVPACERALACTCARPSENVRSVCVFAHQSLVLGSFLEPPL